MLNNRRGDYSTILTEPEVNICFSIFTQSDLNRIRKETITKKKISLLAMSFSGKIEARINLGAGFLSTLETRI